MNVNANNFGQVFSGNDTKGVFANVSIKPMSKDEFVSEMEKQKENNDAYLRITSRKQISFLWILLIH